MALVIASLIIIALSIACSEFVRTPFYKKHNPIVCQIFIGILFGLAAVYSTEFGSVTILGASITVRDAAVVYSGLFFGPWAGIVAGLIGGIERFFAVYHGLGSYTQIACMCGTIFAGVFSAVCKVTLFKKNPPTVLHSTVIILITETVHTGLTPLTHLDDVVQAVAITYACFGPIVIINALVVVIASFVNMVINEKRKGLKFREIFTKQDLFFSKDLYYSFQFWLLCIIGLAFVVTSVFLLLFNNKVFLTSVEEEWSCELAYVEAMAEMDMANTNDTMMQSVTKVVELKNSNIANNVNSLEEIKLILIGPDDKIICGPNSYQGISEAVNEQMPLQLFQCDVADLNSGGENTEICALYDEYMGYKLVEVQLEKYTMFLPHLSFLITLSVQIIVFGIMLLAVYMLLKKLVGENLDEVNKKLHNISHGNLNEKVEIYKHTEFAQLSESINMTVDTLKEYIEAEANRYNKDFEMAHQIQMSALPQTFPPFPHIDTFELFAKYEPAKEVGGDFYDYFIINKNKLVFLVADVSGKGIPAAMFMMRAKTAVKAVTDRFEDPAKILELINNYLCINNELDMFVTMWLGLLNINTGEVIYANAGHNPAILVSKDEKTLFVENKPGLVLGGMENMKYNNITIQLKPKDMLVLYTDGITEANNKEKKLYGDKTLLEFVNAQAEDNPKEIINDILFSVEQFSKGAEQFDDMTLLALQYYENADQKTQAMKQHMEENISVPAKSSSTSIVAEKIQDLLIKDGISNQDRNKVMVVIDEIFSNIVNYGRFEANNSSITIRYKNKLILGTLNNKDSREITLVFEDKSFPFNPLASKNPQTDAALEEREIGGLGIFLAKQIADDLAYERRDDKNILTVKLVF